jgi:hypothetical protein
MVMGTIIILSVCGLVFDGGLMISAKRQATSDAESAARAGAQGVDTGSVYVTGPNNSTPPQPPDKPTPSSTTTAGPEPSALTPERHRDRHPQHLTFLTMFGLGNRTITGGDCATGARAAHANRRP